MPANPDPDQIDSIKRKLALKQRFQAVFSSPEGRLVLQDIFTMANVFTPTAVDNNPYMTYLNEGMRRLALSISHQVFEDDRHLMEMLNLNEEKEQ